VLSDDQQICEATVTELNDGLSAFIERAMDGQRIVITKHHRPVAVLVSIDGAAGLLLAESKRFTAMRREAREELEAGLAVDLPLPRWR
jgi:prevent-host-death family protein